MVMRCTRLPRKKVWHKYHEILHIIKCRYGITDPHRNSPIVNTVPVIAKGTGVNHYTVKKILERFVKHGHLIVMG